MTDTRKSGIALIAGSFGLLLTMAIHPVGSGTLDAAQAERLAHVSAIAHSLAIVSLLLLVLGAFGLARLLAALDRVTEPDRLAFTGLVVYVFSAFTMVIAAAVSGFIVPNMMRHMAQDASANAESWHVAIYSVFQFNQAFAAISIVAGSVAMALWSAAALRHGGLRRGIAVYGLILAPNVILAICSGHLRLNVHATAVVALAQSIWFIAAGAGLYGEK